MDEEDGQNPLDQLVDLLVYAPVGLLYEYQNVMPRLVRRGKSQVQLARVVGKLAVDRGKDGPMATANQVGELMSLVVTRGLTDFGEAIGLAPPSNPRSTTAPAASPPPPPPPTAADRVGHQEQPALHDNNQVLVAGGGEVVDIDDGATGEPEPGTDQTEELPLPIAGYDELTAKVIIPLLDELDPDQLARIRAHEEANRARKTVLGKLERLDG